MDTSGQLEQLAKRHGLVAIYLFGSRAHDGLALLAGKRVAAAGSDLDIGVVTQGQPPGWRALADLQIAMEDLFAPLRVDLVPLHAVDALFQFRAIDGHRVAAPNPTAANLWELEVMRRAAELLPIQRVLEVERFGVSTS
jgi:predicted nucleotidyltransferase